MEIPKPLLPLFMFLLTLPCFPTAHCHISLDPDFLHCLSRQVPGNSTPISRVLYSPQNSSYLPILESQIRNPRFATPRTPKPVFIVTPVVESQIQAVVLCSRQHGLQIRTRSGGHDYEGLSYVSRIPFVVIDLINMSDISIDVEQETAWVQTGATIGQVYYQISQKSRTLAFPAGACPTVGVGGHFSGGGYGALFRQYGLAADNIVDARIVDVNGRILDRKSMGEDLFWAIRGGGGASFGVITAWKLNLVPVPKIVTIFSVVKTLEENGTKILHKWQYVAPHLPKVLLLAATMAPSNSSRDKTILITFLAVYLGRTDKLMESMAERFPELGVKRSDCQEVSWIQSAVFVGGYPIEASPEVLASRIPLVRLNFKAKSDYVQEPIPEHGLEGIWKIMLKSDAVFTQLIFSPYGGKMAEIPGSALPFPHRAGYLYKIQHLVYWNESSINASKRHLSWIRGLYKYMTPYVTKSPRSAYINYRDLDIGTNNEGNTSYAKASVWGLKYFGDNFDRLVRIKTKVDPSNFFRDEQSIPLHYF